MFSDWEWLLISHNNYKPIVTFNRLGSNFNGLQCVYGEDVLSKIKGCEFHFKDSINWRVWILYEKGQKFKELATELLYAMAPESYKNAKKNVKVSIKNEEGRELSGWLECWHNRRHFVFRAFKGYDDPRSNQTEVIHAGWFYKCYIYLRYLSLFIFSKNFIRTK